MTWEVHSWCCASHKRLNIWNTVHIPKAVPDIDRYTQLYLSIYLTVYISICTYVPATTMCVYTHNPTTSTSKTVYEICVLLGKYTTYSGKSLPNPKARTDSLSRQVGRNYHNKPRNFPVERSSPLLRGGSLKSWKHCVSAQYAPCTHLATRVANIQFFPPILVVWFLFLGWIFLPWLVRHLDL